MIRATGYGDFSRPGATRDADQSVRMQQGRLYLDSDWNDHAELTEQRLSELAADVWGPVGGPTGGGWRISTRTALELAPQVHAAVPSAAATAATSAGGRVRLVVLGASRDGAGVLAQTGFSDGAGWRVLVDQRRTVRLDHGDADGGIKLPPNPSDGRWPRPAIVGVEVHGERVRLVVDDAIVDEAPWLHLADGDPGLWLGGRDPATVPTARVVVSDLRVSSTDGVAVDDIGWWPLTRTRGASVADRLGGDPLELTGRAARWRLVDLDVAAGRIYVQGVPVTLVEPVLFSEQEHAPGLPVPESGRHEVHLQVWGRTVGPAQDPGLREPALGGADTTVRTRIVATVRVSPHMDDHDDTATRPSTGRLRAERRGGLALENRLYRVEVHRGGTTGRRHRYPAEASVVGEQVWLRVADPAITVATGEEVIVAGRTDAGDRVVRMCRALAVVRTTAGTRLRLADGVTLDDIVGVTVEGPAPTFKWSRSNGSVVLPVTAERPDATTLGVTWAAPSDLPLRPGDVVELLDDHSDPTGRVARLPQVLSVDPDDGLVELDGRDDDVSCDDPRRHPVARRWDHLPEIDAADGALVIRPDEWCVLDDGVAVCFEPGSYRHGDFWWVVTRTDGLDRRWTTAHGHPVLREPDGIDVLRIPLARLALDADTVHLTDCRGWADTPPLPDDRPGPDPSNAPVVPDTPDDDVEDPDPTPTDGSEPEEPSSRRPGHGEHERTEVSRRAAVPAVLVAVAGSPPEGYVATGALVRAWSTWSGRLVPTDAEGELGAVIVVGQQLFVVTTHAVVRLNNAEAHTVARLPRPRIGFGCAPLSDRIVLAGGRPLDSRRADGAVLSWDPLATHWDDGPSLPVPVEDAAVVGSPDSDDLHVIGGRRRAFLGTRATAAHQVYLAADGTWEQRSPLPVATADAAAVVSVTGELHLLGGRTARTFGDAVTTAHWALRRTGRWHRAPELPVAVGATGAAALTDGRLIAVGSGPDLVVVALDEQAPSWTPVASPGHVTGRVLIAAGDDHLYAVARSHVEGQLLVLSSPLFPSLEVYRHGGSPE